MKIVSKGVVLMGNNASCKIASIGMVKIKMFDGVIRTLGDVRHILNLKRNLILLSTLDSKWYKYIGECRVLKVNKCVLIVMKGKKRFAKLYVFRGSTITGDVTVATHSLSDGDVTRL
ncbi:hypothetical protein CK203_062320 [Vitis vinifera]|uniref:Retrovirus-related Pol polyprotein from transposon TNT 1-94-like beta-barrel domain-containing protein n=1 Tax=Vitis vinifera TaxID=29760 RepID=A0A438GT67_VITVI|nr:hypothetical protein CK203_062320 [Vitis vinifera]